MRRSVFADARPATPPAPVRREPARATHLPSQRPGVSFGAAMIEEQIRADNAHVLPRCGLPGCLRASVARGLCALCLGRMEVCDGR